MSDLISRSELIKELNKYCGNQRYLVSENIREIINNQPTAYDIAKVVEELEVMKAIKEMDLSIPQHFTKEQSGWIKAYCIKRNIEFYNKALDDFVKFANTMPTVETEDGEIRPMRLEEMAEKLKAGEQNDR